MTNSRQQRRSAKRAEIPFNRVEMKVQLQPHEVLVGRPQRVSAASVGLSDIELLNDTFLSLLDVMGYVSQEARVGMLAELCNRLPAAHRRVLANAIVRGFGFSFTAQPDADDPEMVVIRPNWVDKYDPLVTPQQAADMTKAGNAAKMGLWLPNQPDKD